MLYKKHMTQHGLRTWKRLTSCHSGFLRKLKVRLCLLITPLRASLEVLVPRSPYTEVVQDVVFLHFFGPWLSLKADISLVSLLEFLYQCHNRTYLVSLPVGKANLSAVLLFTIELLSLVSIFLIPKILDLQDLFRKTCIFAYILKSYISQTVLFYHSSFLSSEGHKALDRNVSVQRTEYASPPLVVDTFKRQVDIARSLRESWITRSFKESPRKCGKPKNFREGDATTTILILYSWTTKILT